ncbi:MAG: bifunctional glutamate N-acetyltransferase/amino-acid acetyltransferase ArgJ [Hyphomicrobiaceae bacterium]|nr:bifunctional glutamate N-acetyltransferase/amino-acid acetyltransferase ArgJ [Hyphomicrobiaceae bacterium]
MSISPFAPKSLPELPLITGVRLASCEAGIRYKDRKDLTLATFASGTVVGGVFTRSKTAAAPVDWCREHLAGGTARALVVNAGNANAFTGIKGRDAVRMTASSAAAAVGCEPGEVFIASTGVIGEALDPDKFDSKLGALEENLSDTAWEDAARAIMTTDTFPKLATRSVEIDGQSVSVNGIAKGSGMIAPDMATMLAFVFTDAPLTRQSAQAMCAAGAEKSFNAITVDGDTSTNDTVLLFATGAARARGVSEIPAGEDDRGRIIASAIEDVLRDLAHQVVMDGEGASKFITVVVEGAENPQSARRIAFSIANSPLVKTAFAGEDPNWGRVVMAVGKSGEAADRDKLSIWFGDIRVAAGGEVDPDYLEADAAAYMKKPELELRVDVGVGDATATVWTCDLTSQYIAINADYRS